MGVLVRQEIGLATSEITYKANRVGQEVAVVAVGGLVAYAGLLAIIIALATAGMPWWLAALVVGIVVAGIGAVMVQHKLGSLKRVDLAPRQTMQTLKDDTQWAKEQMS